MTGESSAWDEFAREHRALGVSMFYGIVLAAVGIAIGVVTGSQIILFDGFYTFLGIALSWMAMRVSRLVASGPTSRYPFGREALVPLIIGVEAVALLATCAYASFNAVLSILHGGDTLTSGWGVGYAIVSLLVPTSVWWWLRRMASDSELVRAEATQWLTGGALGSGMIVAYTLAHALAGTTWKPATHYLDPSLVIVACLIFVAPPLKMIRTTFIELVEGSPDSDLRGPADEAVNAVSTTFGLAQRNLRMTKIGRKFYVELEFTVEPSWTVEQSDLVRNALAERLDALPHDLWLTVEFTANPSAWS